MSSVLLCIDYVFEIVNDKGKLYAKGYADFVKRHATLDALAMRQEQTRASGGQVVHVHLGFEKRPY